MAQPIPESPILRTKATTNSFWMGIVKTLCIELALDRTHGDKPATTGFEVVLPKLHVSARLKLWGSEEVLEFDINSIEVCYHRVAVSRVLEMCEVEVTLIH